MNSLLLNFLSLDVPALLTASCAAISCALLGNFLVLRRLSLMGDAISHAVLPGIVAAFLITGSRSSLPVFLGAAAAGVLTTILVEVVRRQGRVESGAAMGVVFSVLFALGVLMIEQAAARSVDLDADCLLYGQLETIFWTAPGSLGELFSVHSFMRLPSEVHTSVIVLLLVVVFITALSKELKIAAFDPALATSLGFNAGVLHYLLMIFVAAAVVASFEAVGSILVIAMIICPPAAARLLTDTLRVQVWLSAALALCSAVGGYLLAAFGPRLFGFANSVNAAGMIAVFSGCILGLAVLAAPRYGILASAVRRLRLSLTFAREDIVAMLFRAEELSSSATPVTLNVREVRAALGLTLSSYLGLRNAEHMGLLTVADNEVELTSAGREAARRLVRTHRLWESYLVEKLGLRADHVHDRAMELEHFTSAGMSERLAEGIENAAVDPHGRVIPDRRSGDPEESS